jgi:predicted NAD/FAD-dependent oxidoreductase
MIVVIGSGPAGVSAAKALVAQGKRVTVLDAGPRLCELLGCQPSGQEECPATGR